MSFVLFASTTPKYSQCISFKKKKLEQIESKIDFGLDRFVKKK